MIDLIIKLFAVIGFGVTFVMVCVLIMSFVMWLKEQFIFLKKRRRDRHRGEGAPVAKCRCEGCGNWRTYDKERKSGLCDEWGKYTDRFEFCYRGYLRTKQEYEKEEWRLNST